MEKLKNKTNWVLCLISILAHGIFVFTDGYIISKDTPSYIEMSPAREWVYCTFLAIFRWLCGEQHYLYVVIVIQTILMAYAVYRVSVFLQEEFQCKWYWSYIYWSVFYLLHVVYRLFSRKSVVYHTYIGTEGLAIAIWLLFMVRVLAYVWNKQQKKHMIIALIYACILTSIRKQMMISFAILLIVSFLVNLTNKSIKHWILVTVISAVCSIGFLILSECSYNGIVHDHFARRTEDATFFLGAEIYVADESMADCFADEEIKELYLTILSQSIMQEKHDTVEDRDWVSVAKRYENSYDDIKFFMATPVVNEYLRGKYGDDFDTWMIDDVMSQLMHGIFWKCLPRMLKISLCNTLSGFVITAAAKVTSICNWLALVIYIGYFVCMILLWKKDHHHKALQMATIILLAVAINAAATGLVLFSMVRYMIYNMGLFYCSGLTMLLEIKRK